MLLDRVSNPGPLTYESGALPIALRGPALLFEEARVCRPDWKEWVVLESKQADINDVSRYKDGENI